ncbi:MAG: type II secretion system F family protein [Clostridiales bacterium]|nr:type II secretion system F family protein [Clostridiales bacterium]
MKKIIDQMTGDRKHFEQSYLKLYGKQDCTGEIQSIKKSLFKKYVCLAAAVAVLALALAVHGIASQGSGTALAVGDEISITRPQEGESALKIPLRLEALWGESEKMTRNVTIFVRPSETEGEGDIVEIIEEDELAGIEAEIRKLVKTINNSSSGEKVLLPAELGSGIKLSWNEPKNTRFNLLLPLSLLAVFIVYRSRYSKVRKLEADAKESVIRELPEFINKLVLLLNAGLVLTSAFDRILERHASRGKEVVPYFYSQLLQINRGMRETNSPLGTGLKEFAGRSGVREFMRVANIIADNIDKGAELVEKLKGESELLWLTKRKLAEEKGRLAETKLTFPLVILLLVLIMVTIAPALMEM